MGLDGRHLGLGVHAYADPAEQPASRFGVQLAERHRGNPEVGGVGVLEEPGPEHPCGQGEGRLVGVQVERGDRDQTPEPVDGPGRLPVGAEPVAERRQVGGRVVGIDAAQRERGGDRPPPLGVRQRGVRRERGTEVQRRRSASRPPQPRPVDVTARLPPVQDGDGEAVLYRCQVGDSEPAEQLAVRVVAAQEDVLSGVDREVAALEGVRRAAKMGAGLQQHDPRAPVGQPERRGDAGQPAADHDDGWGAGSAVGAHAAPRVNARAATASFSLAGSDSRARRQASGSARIRPSNR